MSKLDPYEGINFIERHAEIVNSEGEIIFSEKVTFPDYFSDNDVNIVASKYLCNEGKKKETHLKEMIDRVSDTISNWGFEDGYFKTEEERDIFNYKLKYYQVHQYCAFNSPVYFNIGLRDHPQLSACFILSIEDNMSSITEVGALEARIFKQGSGSGINYSPLRSTFETVSGGGFASGPVSFLQSHDLSAGVIKSGGTLRRSAKLACLDDTHPNIEEFICCKEREEEKLRILQEAGFKPKKGYDLSDEVFFQNTNISVRLSDKFMEAVENDDDWWTYYVSSGQKHKKYKARDLLKLISKQAWKIADPGVQFHDNINKMHTCPEDGDIVSSNPCLPDWAPVLTPNGYKRFSDIENKINIGGEDKECSDVFETGWKRVYKVELESGLDIYATANHKILTKRGDVELEKLNTEIDEIKVNFIPIKLEINKNSNEYRLGKSDAYNLYNKELNEEIDLLSKTLDYQFGFIDFFRSVNNRYIFIPESHHLKQIQLILASKGIYSEVIKNRYLKIYFEDEKLDKREYQKIKSIKSISAVKVYDITVPDGNHFVTSGVVVHNCSEYMFINNSSCNLSAINYMKFISKDFDDEFHLDIKMLQDVVETLFTAQDIFIDRAKYPNEEITKNSHEFRPIGLGHSNLGAVLMYLGYPYDSKKGRRTASYLTALITAIAYKTSSKLAEIKGPFKHFDKNQEHFYRVLLQHKASLNEVVKKDVDEDLFLEEIKEFSVNVWDDILELIDNKQPFRNAQATLLAPNGTTSYLMGCATTGIEPEFSLIRYKRLSGSNGAVIKHFNPILKEALQNLICSNREVNDALKQIEEDNCIDNVDVLSEDEKKIFSTSVSPGKYEIPYTGHLKMLAALQPFVSGSISKTVNMPHNVTEEDIYNLYLQAWKMGLKCVAIYRDGSKQFQPLSTSIEEKKESKDINIITKNIRKKLPKDRSGKIHKFRIGGQTKGYIMCGEYDNGELGEIFINISKQGSTLSGLMDVIATLSSISLQYGVPLKDIVRKMMHQKFEPAGFTDNEEIRTASSLVDYIFKFIGMNYLNDEEKELLGLTQKKIEVSKEIQTHQTKIQNKVNISTEPCPNCGMLLRRLGSCSFCVNCNWNSGSCG